MDQAIKQLLATAPVFGPLLLAMALWIRKVTADKDAAQQQRVEDVQKYAAKLVELHEAQIKASTAESVAIGALKVAVDETRTATERQHEDNRRALGAGRR